MPTKAETVDTMGMTDSVLEDANVSPISKSTYGVSRILQLGRIAAASILAEVGMDMSTRTGHSLRIVIIRRRGRRYVPATMKAPANERVGELETANHWLRATMTQTAWAGAAKKDLAFQLRYRRVKLRRDAQRAVTPVSHAQLIALYWVLRNGSPYQEPIA